MKRMQSPVGWYPKRGDVCLLTLDKERPAVVISSGALNIHSLDLCVVPFSTVEHEAFSLRPRIRAREGGLNKDSWAKCDPVTTVPKTSAIYPAFGSLSQSTLARIAEAIKLPLELP